MVEAVLPIFLFAAVAVAVSLALLGVGALVGPRLGSGRVKEMPYESGMDPIHDTRRRFDVRFCLVAVAFLVFDVELLFLYPWATAAYPPANSVHKAAYLPAGLSTPVFAVMLVFTVTLVLAYAYAWKKGVFTWR